MPEKMEAYEASPGGMVRRLSSCLLRSISWVQLSPSAHTRRDFSCTKMISGKRESVS